MPGTLKAYYLLQASYWCQQTIILAAGVEKPRKDFKELIAHVSFLALVNDTVGLKPVHHQHLVTLWLIGWSYLLTVSLGENVFHQMAERYLFS
jgi:acyl-CoA-dependent ceramide synthase